MSDTPSGKPRTVPDTFGVFGPRWHVRVRAISHAERRALCRAHGVKDTGRQWRKLRRRLGLALHRREWT